MGGSAVGGRCESWEELMWDDRKAEKFHDEAMIPGHDEMQDGTNMKMHKRPELRKALSFSILCAFPMPHMNIEPYLFKSS